MHHMRCHLMIAFAATFLTGSMAFAHPLHAAMAGSDTTASIPADHADSAAVTQESGDSQDDWTTFRTGGDLFAAVELVEGVWTFGEMMIEAPLPDGYPQPTPPGAIELKRYPAARRADVTMTGNADRGRNGAFWPLFQHIKERDIAMTSPVEMYFHSDDEAARTSPGVLSDADAWTMSFLYRTPDMGKIETDGVVEVVDAAPITVVSMGMRGPYMMQYQTKAMKQVLAWLDAQDEWEQAGEPRLLYYNGPYVPDADKWCEVQIPVRRKS
jgi:hypothetical protein